MKNIKTSSETLESSDKSYYPIFLNIKDMPCLVVGGGHVAERKVLMLLKFKARIKVVAPYVTKKIDELAKKGRIEIIKREFKREDIEDTRLVFAATDNKVINEEIKEEAQKRGIFVNVVDDPGLCDFIVPSIVKRGSLIIAISTSGVLPLFAKILKRKIREVITDDYIKYMKLMGRFRKVIISEVKEAKKRKKIMKQIEKSDIKEMVGLDINALKKRFLNNL